MCPVEYRMYADEDIVKRLCTRMSTFGERLAEERQRLGKSQEDLATSGGVLRGAQFNYEKDRRAPDTRYLAGIAEAGVDIRYVLTGLREGAPGVADTGSRYPARDPLCDQIQRLPARERDALKVLVASILGAEHEESGG